MLIKHLIQYENLYLANQLLLLIFMFQAFCSDYIYLFLSIKKTLMLNIFKCKFLFGTFYVF